MGRPASKTVAWLKKGMSATGILAFLAGGDWLWRLRDVWPRAAGDPVPQPLVMALGVIIGGAILVAWGRPAA